VVLFLSAASGRQILRPIIHILAQTHFSFSRKRRHHSSSRLTLACGYSHLSVACCSFNVPVSRAWMVVRVMTLPIASLYCTQPRTYTCSHQLEPTPRLMPPGCRPSTAHRRATSWARSGYLTNIPSKLPLPWRVRTTEPFCCYKGLWAAIA
jgi:hypothetical protein